ncbi:MAG: hypothetical protein MUE33_12040 [Cytophagaceae bacterium]|jgi:hypothetical protein|nr:hypothetical protein [Cytophagaceae bacterium]
MKNLNYIVLITCLAFNALAQDTIVNSSPSFKSKGYVLGMDFQAGVGNAEVEFKGTGQVVPGPTENLFALNIQNAYRFNSLFQAGIGTGLKVYASNNQLTAPFTLDAMFTPLKGRVSPLLAFSAGKTLGLYERSTKMGTVVSPQVGVRTFVSPTTALYFTLNYEWHRYFETNLTNTSNLITFRVGAQF